MEEIWKAIPDTDGRYEVSNFGRVRTNNQRPGLLTLTKQASGYRYAMVRLNNGKSKNCRVHRLVAKAFLPNPDNLNEINHKDGNKDNNHVDNLEWSNRSENMKHAMRTGLSKPKEYAHHWTDKERKEISQRLIAYNKRVGRYRTKPKRTRAEYQAERRRKAEARRAEYLAEQKRKAEERKAAKALALQAKKKCWEWSDEAKRRASERMKAKWANLRNGG